MPQTGPPDNEEDIYSGGQRIPEDDTRSLIKDLVSGDDTQVVDDEDNLSQGDGQQLPWGPSVSLPPVVQRVLESPRKDELINVARELELESQRPLVLEFHSSIGMIRCPVTWSNVRPDDLTRSEGLLIVKMDRKQSNFIPAPGVRVRMGFQGAGGTVTATCLSEPQALYPNVDLLCFLTHNSEVEKNGRLKSGAPSVVSGMPSDEVDEHGEPVVEGEKSASFAPVRRLEKEGREDFDVTREPVS